MDLGDVSSRTNLLGSSTIYRPTVQPRVSSGHRQINPTHSSGWSTFLPWTPKKWNGQHQRLPSQDTPCISACTTATNLSSLGDFQSNSTIYNSRRMNLDENLRMTIPEIQPLQDNKEKDDSYEVPELPQPKTKVALGDIKMQLLTAIAVSWVSMIIGYCSAYTSPASISLERDFSLSKVEMSWVTSLMPLGALGGGILGGLLIENLGRKWTILLTDLLFLGAFLVNYFAQNYIYMYVSRIVSGVSVGILSLTLPVYLAETIQPEVRGTLGLLPTAFGNIGILLCYLFGTFWEWRALAMVGVLLSIPFVIVFWVIRETPRFLISKGKEDEMQQALQWLRGQKTNIDKEYHELKKSYEEENETQESTWESLKILFSLNNLKLMGIVLGLMAFQQFSGINAVIFNTTKIFQESGSSIDKAVSTTIVGVVNFISTFIAAVLIDKLGRKVLLYISAVSMVLSLGVLGAYFFLKDAMKLDVQYLGFLPLASFIIYVLGFSLGFGPVPWLMMGEILPARIRGPAASVATGFNWTCTFIVTKTFLLLPDCIGYHFTFWLFGAIVFLSLLFTIFFVPETRGQSLADIERKLAGIKVRRMSSVANLKPMPSSF
ncbi:facilitated trehalose transporter Tret1-2 homolog isoform X1 [Anthonomus grandis grandis]|uniref:facilitated trehalose transporter Tret1-2 homolog isoform X1 n=1 Tax=Anthonomus grandis grandis TaxID=2921223 RepID=UPI002166A283|nr:facilitated trehalose transporter Tret1-2 homolog isoform X1 [Anthonomus grandis grandis]